MSSVYFDFFGIFWREGGRYWNGSARLLDFGIALALTGKGIIGAGMVIGRP
jgi:hypothetical protein